MRRTLSSSVAALVAVLVLLAPHDALAGSCTARAGSSAIDQYCEAIPSATGTRLSKQDADRRSGERDRVAPPATTALKKAGADGAAVLQLAGGERPQAPRKRAARRPRGGDPTPTTSPAATSPAAAPEPADRSGGVLKAVATSATGGPAAGGALVWILLATTLGVAAAAWLSYRHKRD